MEAEVDFSSQGCIDSVSSDEAEDLVDAEGRLKDVPIPKDMAAEANKRFPFLWRTEYQMR